jgi:transcriptional regulator with XRE-family HTH domain
MNLKDYLEKKKISQADYARRLDVSPITVWRWCRGLPPSISHARWIVEDTKGKVMFDDLMGGKDARQPKAKNRNPVERGEISK